LGPSAAELVQKYAETFGEKSGEKISEAFGDSLTTKLKEPEFRLERLCRETLRICLLDIHTGIGLEGLDDWFANWEICLAGASRLKLPPVEPEQLDAEKIDDLFLVTMERLDAQGLAMRRGSLSLTLQTRTLPNVLVSRLKERLPQLFQANFYKLIVAPEGEQAWKESQLLFQDFAKAVLFRLDQKLHLIPRIADDTSTIREMLAAYCQNPIECKQRDVFFVPHDRNLAFTGREEVLAALRQALTAESAAAISQSAAISGLGGVGKTQVALEYVWRYRRHYNTILWITAETEQTLSTGFSTAADLLQVPGRQNPEQELVRKAVLRWLESHNGWLVVFDNADRPELLAPCLPRQHQGHILLTSRRQVFDSAGLLLHPIVLQELIPAEARSFLIRRTGRDSLDESETLAADAIAHKLGYLPLALEQAAAYILQRGTRFQDYLLGLCNRDLELLEKQQPVMGNYALSVTTAWALNFSEIEQSSGSADLLRLSAFLAADAIPLDLLASGLYESGCPLSDAVAGFKANPLVLDDLLEPLLRYSLIQRRPNVHDYSLHRLTQGVVRCKLDPKRTREWAEHAITAVALVFPTPDVLNWTVCERLIAHAQACAAWVSEWNIETKGAALLMKQSGSYLADRARFAEAEPLYKGALSLQEKIVGREHPITAASVQSLALLYYHMGRYLDAELLYSRALAIRQKTLGPEHPDTAQTLNDLALLYTGQGRYDDAEPLYRRALEVREKSLGPEHADTGETLHNLAGLQRAKGDYAEAERLQSRAVTVLKNALTSEHLRTITALQSLGLLYYHQGRYDEAEPLYQLALDVRERLLGPEDPRVATTLHNLAALYCDQGRYAEAELLYRRALDIREKVLGPEHPDIARTLSNLAECQHLRQKGHNGIFD
jgi:tetratricopeptide (TPR) repeat protein